MLMYFPILRGKQFELIALRELAGIIDCGKVIPIIEPVRKNFTPLVKTIKVLKEAGIICRVVINPAIGDFSEATNFPHNIFEELTNLFSEDEMFIPVISTKNLTGNNIKSLIKIIGDCSLFFDGGFQSGLEEIVADMKEVFILGNYPKKAFKNAKNLVEINDNFQPQKRNADYPEKSFYSDKHNETFPTNNLIGFGDYTIVTKDYSDSGGPAYVVALHLSYIDGKEYDSMIVRHFKSTSDSNLPVRTGEKFEEALLQLRQFVVENIAGLHHSTGLESYQKIDTYPGLGQVKKYSIKHHIETINAYIKD